MANQTVFGQHRLSEIINNAFSQLPEFHILPVGVGHVVDVVERLVVDGVKAVTSGDAELDVLNVVTRLEVDARFCVGEEGLGADDVTVVVDGPACEAFQGETDEAALLGH